MERIRKQINNLSIRSTTKGKVQIFAPNKEMIKEFDTIEEAENYAKNNKDFRYKKQQNLIPAKNNLHELCDFINELQKFAPNQIGSIEYYHTMTENAIVQILDKNRGFKVLRYGTEAELKRYLLDILNNTTITFEI